MELKRIFNRDVILAIKPEYKNTAAEELILKEVRNTYVNRHYSTMVELADDGTYVYTFTTPISKLKDLENYKKLLLKETNNNVLIGAY